METGKGRRRGRDSMDDILGDLLAEDTSSKAFQLGQSKGKTSVKDDGFYSNLAAMADDNPDSDISEADVDQVAKRIADLDDMDADLFGGQTKKNSIKSRSGKPTTPRRSSNTPRSRGGTPRSGKLSSPRRTPGSPTRSETSPPGSARGSVKRLPSKQSSVPPPQVDYRPGTAPGKMTDLGKESENLRPGQMQKSVGERPQTVPKAKPKIDYGEFNEEDPLAGLLSDEDDSEIEPKKKPLLKTTLKHSSSEDVVAQPESKPDFQTEIKNNSGGITPSLFDRPPTRSGTGTATPESKADVIQKSASKKREERLFSDDEDMLDGLGIDEKPKTLSMKNATEESRPARSVFDSLLGKDSVNKHLQKTERKEFILDTKKLSQTDDEEDDLVFGDYKPSSVTGSRPTSRRSVRFQDDDIFGAEDKPSSRGRPDSAKSSKAGDDMDWLELASGNRTSIDTKNEIPKTQEKKELKTGSKSGSFDWLGLKDSASNDDDLATSNQSQLKTERKSLLKKEDSNDDWLNKLKVLNHGDEEIEEQTSADKVSKEKTTLASKVSKEKTTLTSQPDDYLGLGKEIDLDDLLSNKPESPTFPGQKPSAFSQEKKDLFETPNIGHDSVDDSFRRRRLVVDDDNDDIFAAPTPKSSNPKEDSTANVTSQQVPISSQLTQLEELDESPHFKKRNLKPQLTRQEQHQEPVIQTSVFPSRDPNLQNLRNVSTPPSSDIASSSQLYTSAPVQQATQQYYTLAPQSYHSVMNPASASSPQQIILPNSLPEALAMIHKLSVEKQYADSLLEGTRRRYEEEVIAIETSFRNRMTILEESNHKKEARLREETEQLMEKHLSRIRQMEEEKAELANENYRKLEELERQKAKDLENIKEQHRISFSEIKREHEEAVDRLKEAKNREINAVANANDTSRSLTAVVQQIQTSTKDLGSLQSQVESIHRSGLDEREINLKAKDQQLHNLQERLSRQEEDNEKERKRLEDLIARMEMQLRDQTRLLDEERWKMKGDVSRLEANQRSLEEEKRMWLEQQTRERSALERSRDNFQEENRTSMSLLNNERRSLAEERMKWNVDIKLHREQSHQEAIKMAQAEAEYEVLTKTIAEEKTRSSTRKQELFAQEERLANERIRIEREKSMLEDEKNRMSSMALQIKSKSAEIDSMTEMASRSRNEGDRSLMEAKNIESQHIQRLSNIQNEMQKLKTMEENIAQEKLKISRERQDQDKLRSSGLCVNCRSPLNGTVPPGVNQMVNSQNFMMSSPIPGVHSGKYSSPMYNGYGGGQVSVNAIETITTSIAADRSIRMWKIQALKDKDFLEEESMFLETLKHSPYH